jgi:uncharacterized protein (DUF924 family)
MAKEPAMTPPSAQDVLTFWFEETAPKQWFAADPAFDERVRARFGTLHEEAARGALDGWMATPEGALALILLLDQLSRNLFRGQAAAFAQDDKAVALADAAIEKGHDLASPADRRAFFYLPYMHAEDLALQDKCIALIRERLGEDSMNLPHAVWHRDVIKRFGRFPYRNAALARESTAEEAAFLARENVPG